MMEKGEPLRVIAGRIEIIDEVINHLLNDIEKWELISRDAKEEADSDRRLIEKLKKLV